MKTIYTVLFIVIMTLIGRVEAVERIQPVPEGTKIYIQSAGKANRYMVYQFSTERCKRAYGYVDTATGKEVDLPRTDFSCASPRAPRLIDGAAGLTIVQKLDADSYYVKNVEI